jgi:hypothetical protein
MSGDDREAPRFTAADKVGVPSSGGRRYARPATTEHRLTERSLSHTIVSWGAACQANQEERSPLA